MWVGDVLMAMCLNQAAILRYACVYSILHVCVCAYGGGGDVDGCLVDGYAPQRGCYSEVCVPVMCVYMPFV